MNGRSLALAAGASITLVLSSLPAAAKFPTTLERTIQDTNKDNLLEYSKGEPYLVMGAPKSFRPPRGGSIINFLHLSDFQMVDEESPARVEFLDASQRNSSAAPFKAAYRPMEALTTHATEAMVRATRGLRSRVTGRPLELAILTGDNADSQQYNETRWFIDILDGGKKVDPNSGVPTDACPAREGSVYDGVRGDGRMGYYEPDESGPNVDGDGYSPDREENQATVGADVTVRDFPGLLEAANRPFKTVGLKMPWYSAFGNHDALVQGNSPEAYFGPYGPSGEVVNPSLHEIATGCTKPVSAPNPGDVPGFFGELMATTNVPAGPGRCFLAKDEAAPGTPEPCDQGGWIEQHFRTQGVPAGHGFTLTSELPKHLQDAGYGRPDIADQMNDGYYSFSPKKGLRFVVLDTITDECGSIFCAEGSVDDPQFQWLESQIETAEKIGEYVIVFSHHTLRTTRWPSTDPSEQPIHYGQLRDRDNPNNPQNRGAMSLEELFCAHPHVLAHVAGHEHENYVRHYTCEKDDPPTAGKGDFWHVSSAAHIDWPQQARMIELIDNGNGTMSLVLTVVDHAGPAYPGDSPNLKSAGDNLLRTLASIGRELAYNDYQNGRESRGRPEDRNVIAVLDQPWPLKPAKG